MGHGGCFWEGPTWAHGCPCTLRPLHRSRSPAGFAVGPFAGDGDAPGPGWQGGGSPALWGGGDKGSGGIVQGPVLGTQQMALPPRAAELGTQLLPTVTSPGGPGHAQRCLSPFPNRDVTSCPAYSFFGRGKEVEGGAAATPHSIVPGAGTQKCHGAEAAEQLRASPFVSAPSGLWVLVGFFFSCFPWVFFKRKAIVKHSSRAHLPAHRVQRLPEDGEGMERWRGVRGRRERETEIAVGIEKESGIVWENARGGGGEAELPVTLPAREHKEQARDPICRR